MKPRTLKLIVAATCPILFLFGMCCRAEDMPQKPAKTVYSLCGGSCARSIKIVETFDDVYAACEAAAKLRKTHEYVGILTGRRVDPLLVHPAFQNELKPKSCSIVRRSMSFRCGQWSTTPIAADVPKAEEMVVDLRKSGRIAEIIYHLPDNESLEYQK